MYMCCITYYASIKARQGILVIIFQYVLIPATVAPPSVPIATNGRAYYHPQYILMCICILYTYVYIHGCLCVCDSGIRLRALILGRR